MIKKRTVILLTACVNPNGMSFTKLQNSEERKRQYIEALHFYLENTSCRVIFVENTNTDFSQLFQQYIYNGQLEYLTFDGNAYPRELGKGFGEGKIIEYAILHSRFFAECTYVVKITGRLIVLNIKSIINSVTLKLTKKCVRFNFSDTSIYSMCFVCPKEWLRDCAEHKFAQINDTNNIFMEHVLFNHLVESHSYLVVPFLNPPQINGVSGTSNRQYGVKSEYWNLCDNLYFLHLFLLKQNKRMQSVIVKYIYYMLIFLGKITSIGKTPN